MEFVIEITDQYHVTRIQTHPYHSRELIIKPLKSFMNYTFVIYVKHEFGSSPKSQPLKIQTTESGIVNSLKKNTRDIFFLFSSICNDKRFIC